MEAMAHQLAESPRDPSLLRSLDAAAGFVDSLPFQVNLRQVQNICYRVLEKVFKGLQQESGQDDPEAQELVELFSSLAQKLRMVVPQDE
jgi:hypothetical protein